MRNPALKLAMLLICMTVAFCHLSLSLHEVEPTSFYGFAAREPFIYRILIPALFRLLPINFRTCSAHLNFPIEHCADLAALCVDWLALTFSCVILLHAYRSVASQERTFLHQPVLVIPIFLWMVIFDFVLVPNNSMYYPYDFLQLLFFSSAVWVGVSARGYGWLPLLAFISTLNKEDAIFLPVTAAIYAAWVGRLDRRMMLSMLAAFIAVALAKYASLMYIRDVIKLPAANPALYENHLFYNLHQLANPIAWLAWLGIFGGGAFILALPLQRIGRLKIIIVALVMAYIPIVFLMGESREIRLFGPLICPVLLPIVLTVDALLYGEASASAGMTSSARHTVPKRLTPARLAAAVIGVLLLVVALGAELVHARARRSASGASAASSTSYQDLLSCESTQIHSCKTGDGQTYDCLFTNDSQAQIELSDIRLWNYDAQNNLIHQQPVDTHFAIPPGRTAHFEFHNVDKQAVHGKLCRFDPQSLFIGKWFNAS
jgi:hypothetical protein